MSRIMDHHEKSGFTYQDETPDLGFPLLFALLWTLVAICLDFSPWATMTPLLVVGIALGLQSYIVSKQTTSKGKTPSITESSDILK